MDVKFWTELALRKLKANREHLNWDGTLNRSVLAQVAAKHGIKEKQLLAAYHGIRLESPPHKQPTEVEPDFGDQYYTPCVSAGNYSRGGRSGRVVRKSIKGE